MPTCPTLTCRIMSPILLTYSTEGTVQLSPQKLSRRPSNTGSRHLLYGSGLGHRWRDVGKWIN
jgi:hypothetical protein